VTGLAPDRVTALLLVDLQRDYLDRPGLVPDEHAVVSAAAQLLEGFRTAGAPVAHVRTLVRADGSDAMPHWRTSEAALPCVEGTPGAGPPAALAERPGELVARKRFYDGFADPRLDPWLRSRGVTEVVIAGVYTHACVRETALAAYERGYRVVIASDAVGSDRPEHAELTYAWLTGRAAHFRCGDEIVGTLPPAPVDAADEVSAAATRAATAQEAWARQPVDARAAALDAWADVLAAREDELVDAIVREVHKVRGAAVDEVRRAIGHVRTAATLARSGVVDEVSVADGVRVRHVPVGVVGILMPWNNPLALPCGKIAPALAFGNGVVFKPAPEGRATAGLLMDTLAAAGLPAGLVGLVHGGPSTGMAVVTDPLVDAVAVTGAIPTGRAIAEQCTRLGKPLQAELGGNNAALVLADADLDVVVPALVRNAFGYAGQRCTAIRRLVVAREIVDEFSRRVVAETAALRVGDPSDPATDVGPLISAVARDRVSRVVEAALAGGAILLVGGSASDTPAGAFYSPTVLRVDDPRAAIVQEETFGPVAVIQPADGLSDAIAKANGVEQGLVQAVCTGDAAAAAEVLAAARAGIVQWGPGMVPVHPDAPFGGWKASGYGPPEHGRWDAQFLTRPQSVYGPA
jgi:alpha-ketoglutaric semialdehyde dehydrogenase